MKKLLGLISFLLVLAGSVSAKVVLPAIFFRQYGIAAKRASQSVGKGNAR